MDNGGNCDLPSVAVRGDLPYQRDVLDVLDDHRSRGRDELRVCLHHAAKLL